MPDAARGPAALPLRALLPNAVTMLALCAGATGVRFAISGHFQMAAASIVIAAVLDGLDGRIARLLKGTSRFGAELDSLADVTAFGLAPALILYLWTLETLGRAGWVIALLYAVCCALRLARFNASIDDEALPKKQLGFTTGVPAPAGAGLALSPLFFSLGTQGLWPDDPQLRALTTAVVVTLAGLAMVSPLAGWGWQSVRVPRRARLFVLLGVGLFAALLSQLPWLTLFALAFAYAASFPFATIAYRKRRGLQLDAAAAVRPPASGPELPDEREGRQPAEP